MTYAFYTHQGVAAGWYRCVDALSHRCLFGPDSITPVPLMQICCLAAHELTGCAEPTAIAVHAAVCERRVVCLLSVLSMKCCARRQSQQQQHIGRPLTTWWLRHEQHQQQQQLWSQTP